MKFPILTSLPLFMLCCLLLPFAAASAELAPYDDASALNFVLPDLKDSTHTLADYKGKVVVVNFWASWCPPCIYEMPELTKLKSQMAGKPFEIIAINVGEKKYRVRKFTRLINFNLPVLLDTSSEVFSAWNVETLPTSFLIDGEGRIRYKVRGNPGWGHELTISVIQQLVAETANTTAVTETVTIKEAN